MAPRAPDGRGVGVSVGENRHLRPRGQWVDKPLKVSPPARATGPGAVRAVLTISVVGIIPFDTIHGSVGDRIGGVVLGSFIRHAIALFRGDHARTIGL